LINNAGFGYYGRFDGQPLQNVEEMIALNITALTVLCRRLIPLMETGGRIINVASSVGFTPLGGYAVYAATKAFVLNFSMALDAEVRSTREITVSAVCPGSVETEFFERARMTESSVMPSRLMMEKPENTARKAIRGSARGRRLIMTGMGGWSFRFLVWLLPRRVIARSLMGKLAREA
jgi:short-subunit dehydrogenase